MSVVDRLTGGPDPAQVRDELAAMKEPERRKRAKAAEDAFVKIPGSGGIEPPSRNWHAAALAWLGTATARKISANFWRIEFRLPRADPRVVDDVYAVLTARGPAFFATLARLLLKSESSRAGWTLVRRAVREEFIEPPQGDEYVAGLVSGVSGRTAAIEQLDSAYRGLLADPELLEHEVWQLFEIDLGSELANAAVWEKKEREGSPYPQYTRGNNRWLYALTRLAAEQRLDRQRLLDASLDALTRDFRASTVGWYVKLHEELEPTREERIARLDRYLALVTSPAPAVSKAGLAALGEIEDAVPPNAFARVAPTPFTQRQKNLSTETLAMLARLCKTHADARSALLEAAAHGLAHERVDVQERALKLLEQYPDQAPRAAMLAYVEAVSPTLAPRLEALTGVVAPREQEPPGEIVIRAPVQPRPTLEVVREVRAQLHPVESVDELIELAAMLVEGRGDGDDCERFLDGVSRLRDERPPGFERRTAGLAKRAHVAGGWGFQAAGASLVAYVVEAWTTRRRPQAVAVDRWTVIGFLARRCEEVAKRAARGPARPLLAFPTHSGGWIDPEVLAERERSTGRLFNRPDSLDRFQASVRAFPALGPLDYVRRVKTKTVWGRPSRELRVECQAPGELGELQTAVSLAGSAIEESGRTWYGPIGWAGVDGLGVRWALTVLPSLPEVAFAGAATAAVTAREGASYHHPEEVLAHALDPQVPLGPEAWLAVAACLAAKSPDLPRVAVDLLVASIEDSRFDAGALGAEIAGLVDNDFAKVNRLEAPLRDVARVSPLHAAQVVRTIEGFLANLAEPPRGLHSLLEVALESSTATRHRVEDDRARTTLERLAVGASPSSKLGRLARALLAS